MRHTEGGARSPDRAALEEALAYYRGRNAARDQQALVALLREVQDLCGGALPGAVLEEVAAGLGLKASFLRAVVGRIPSLRGEEAPHRLELCGGPRCASRGSGALRDFVEGTYGVKSGGASAAGGFTYRVTGCMRQCGRGPSLRWDGELYAGADEALVRLLVEGEKNNP